MSVAVALASFCAAVVTAYAQFESCTLVQRWAVVLLVLAATSVILLFRWLHHVALLDRARGASRTRRLVALVVVPWIGVLLLVDPLFGAMDRGRQKRTMADMRALSKRLDPYRERNGVYPSARSLDELATPLGPPAPFPDDAWRHPLGITSAPERFVLISYGKCGEPDVPAFEDYALGKTSDFCDDIVMVDGTFVRWPEGQQR